MLLASSLASDVIWGQNEHAKNCREFIVLFCMLIAREKRNTFCLFFSFEFYGQTWDNAFGQEDVNSFYSLVSDYLFLQILPNPIAPSDNMETQMVHPEWNLSPQFCWRTNQHFCTTSHLGRYEDAPLELCQHPSLLPYTRQRLLSQSHCPSYPTSYDLSFL